MPNSLTRFNIQNGDAVFELLYGNSKESLEYQGRRYQALLEEFKRRFPASSGIELFSTPGRTEVGGNHTDHNAGKVLAAAIDLDIIAVAAPNGSDTIRIESEDYPPVNVKIDALFPVKEEQFTSAALVRGICAGLSSGHKIGGFDAFISSNIPEGSGLSSSAAFEVLAATILNHLYNGGEISDVSIAKIAQYAENVFFGKPSGLMDQMSSAVGGLVAIDFGDSQEPVIDRVDFDFGASGYTVVVVDTGKNHADLNDEYAAIEREMKAVARALGGRLLRELSLESLMEALPRLHGQLSDRAILRALHYYGDNQRVVAQVQALEEGRFERFLSLVIESGRSSWMLCQNVYSPESVDEQGLSLALAISEGILKDIGAWRVHGGGFAGTIQAFVPHGLVEQYVHKIEAVFGAGACHRLLIRPVGTIHIGSYLAD